MGGKPSVPNDRLPADRTFIITGSNKGIGYETAKKIAQLGGRVIMACRNERRANDAMERMRRETNEDFKLKKSGIPELNIQFMELDLSSLESTIKFARQYKESGLPLHVLICNGGLFKHRKIILTDDGFELHFQVNYLSHFLLTLLLLPLLKQSAPNSRIVNVSSITHKLGVLDLENIKAQKGYGSNKFYPNSKLFQIMNMHSLSRRLSDQHISVFSVHPGCVQTDILAGNTGCLMAFFNCIQYCVGIDSAEGSRASLIAALDEKYAGKTAFYFNEDGKPSGTTRLSRDEEKQEMLWKYSLRCLREKLDDVTLNEIGEKLENIEPLETV